MDTTEKTIDTKDLQMFSLMQAFSACGYSLMRTHRNGLVFLNPDRQKQGDALISMERAIRIYNDVRLASQTFDLYSIEQFKAAKVVKRCKLQYSKSNKTVINQNSMVKFVKPEYEQMFLIVEQSDE